MYNETPCIYRPDLFTKCKHIYVDGYYEHWKYYDSVKYEVGKKFDFSTLKLSTNNKRFLDEIKQERVFCCYSY